MNKKNDLCRVRSLKNSNKKNIMKKKLVCQVIKKSSMQLNRVLHCFCCYIIAATTMQHIYQELI